MTAAGKQTRSKQTRTRPDQLRELVERHRDLRESIELAIGELEKGRPAVAVGILRGTRYADRRKRQ